MRSLTYTAGKAFIKGAYNDVIHDRLYFGDEGGGTSTIAPRDFQVFIVPVGGQTKNISTNAVVTQTLADSSIEGVGGIIPNAQNFVCASIGVNIVLSNTQATTPFTDDATTSINITPLYRVSPIPLHMTLMSQCTFELYRNTNERLEQGNITEYPCPFGNNGFAGGGGASVPAVTTGPLQAAYTINPTILINGAGDDFRQLSVLQEFQPNDQFRGVFKVAREIALSSTLLCGWIDFYLVGRLLVDDEHAQFVDTFTTG
jgi:hypothetical protein